MLELGLSDHMLVYTARKKQKLPRGRINVYTRSYRKYYKLSYYLSMCQVNWLPVLDSRNVDTAAKNFMKLTLSVVDQHAPFKTINCRVKGAEWVSDDLLGLIDAREYLKKAV